MHCRAFLTPLVPAVSRACAGIAVDIEAEEATIRSRGEALVAAESAMDTEAALAFWAPDGILQGHGTPLVEDRENLRATYKPRGSGIGAGLAIGLAIGAAVEAAARR